MIERSGTFGARGSLAPAPGSTAVLAPEPELGVERRPRFEPMWYVILLDDQLHTYDYVVKMLCDLFRMPAKEALQKAIEVDTQGMTICARLPKKEAEAKRDQIMGYGGDLVLKTPVSMKATVEPADD